MKLICLPLAGHAADCCEWYDSKGCWKQQGATGNWQHALVMPAGHPLAALERVTLEDLAAFPLVTYQLHPRLSGTDRSGLTIVGNPWTTAIADAFRRRR